MADPAGNLRAFPERNELPLLPQGVRVSSIAPTRITWISPGRLAAGKITVLDGDPGLGKSTMMLDWAARVTTGRALPGMPGWETNAVVTTPRGVLLLSAEDGDSDTIRPRLDLLGADTSKVVLLAMTDEQGNKYLPTLGRYLYAIEQQIEAADAAMLIIDPLMAYLDAETNANRDQDIRRVLSPVSSMAERTGCAAIVLRHLNKATGMAGLYRGGGSIGIIGAARVGLLAHKDTDDETGQRRFLMVQKCNLGPEVATLVYRLVGVEGTDHARVEWMGESSITAAHVMSQPADLVDRQDLTDAGLWLADELATGPLSANDLFRDGAKAGYAQKTLKRAKAKLAVESYRQGFGKDGQWMWRLPATLVAPAPARANLTPQPTTVDDGWA